MKKILLSIALVLGVPAMLFADRIPADKALRIAREFVGNSVPSSMMKQACIREIPVLASQTDGHYVFNVGRGNAIDPDGLYKVLKEGHLGGCGLDVTEPEPLPAESPLWDLGNLVITPHVAGNFYLAETFERIVKIAGENLSSWANGTPYRNVVDFTTGYRK